MTEGHYEKAAVLMSQGRYNDAEKILGELLAANPNNDYLLYQLSEISLLKENYERAEELINAAIAIDPEDGNYFYLKSRIAVSKDDYKAGESYIITAIALDPHDDDYYAFFAAIKLDKKRYEESLKLADEALALNPSNLLALNMRSTALLKLNRKDESFATIEGALHEDPENAYTHTNYGWGLLEKGEVEKSLKHFSEALRNDPNSTQAQAGMTEALKARFTLYRWFLNYSFWIGNKAAKFQWFFIIGFYFGTRFLGNLASKNEALRPFILPVFVLLVLFAFSTWIIQPVSNVFLRFNRYGHHLLSREEKISSLFVTGALCVCIAGTGLWLADVWALSLYVAIYGFTMMVPLGKMFSRPKSFFMIYAIAMGALGLLALSVAYTHAFTMLSTAYLIGFIGYQFLANYFTIKK